MHVSYEDGRLLFNVLLAKELEGLIDWSVPEADLYEHLRTKMKDGLGCPAAEVYVRQDSQGLLRSQAAIVLPSPTPRYMTMDFTQHGEPARSDVADIASVASTQPPLVLNDPATGTTVLDGTQLNGYKHEMGYEEEVRNAMAALGWESVPQEARQSLERAPQRSNRRGGTTKIRAGESKEPGLLDG